MRGLFFLMSVFFFYWESLGAFSKGFLSGLIQGGVRRNV